MASMEENVYRNLVENPGKKATTWET